MKTLVSITLVAALIGGGFLTVSGAEAGTFYKLKQYQAYDQFWRLKNPGGPVERLSPGEAVSLNPQPLPPRYVNGFVNPGDIVGFNPQPDPPAFQ